MPLKNICLNCGACCAFFRVSFYWREAEPAKGRGISPDLVEEETEFYDNMKGTNQGHPYCAALKGKIGERVGCTIYNERPSPCREFGIHWDKGRMQIDPNDLERCNRARTAWNLPPLTMDLIDSAGRHAELTRLLDRLMENSRNRIIFRRQGQKSDAHHGLLFHS